MNFTFPVTADPNTEKASPKREVTGVAYGTLNQVDIYFPWGCAGLVGVRVIHYEQQLYPTNRSQWFIGNDIHIVFNDDYMIDQGWNEFKVEVYNLDDMYEHTVYVSFNIVVPPEYGPPAETWIEG